MLLGRENKLDDMIVNFLGRHPHATAEAIAQAAHATGLPCTQRAVYKALTRLANAEVLIHRKSSYALRTQWLLALRDFADIAWQTCSRSTLGAHELPRPGKRAAWQFSSFSALINFNAEALVTLLITAKTKTMLDWIPHPWFCLIRPDEEARYLQSLQEIAVRTYRIIGGHTFLDRLAGADWRRHDDRVSWERSPFHGINPHYQVVVDDYILTTRLDRATRDYLEYLYRTVKSLTGATLAEISKLAQRRIVARVSLESNLAKAARIRKIFERHFARGGRWE